MVGVVGLHSIGRPVVVEVEEEVGVAVRGEVVVAAKEEEVREVAKAAVRAAEGSKVEVKEEEAKAVEKAVVAVREEALQEKAVAEEEEEEEEALDVVEGAQSGHLGVWSLRLRRQVALHERDCVHEDCVTTYNCHEKASGLV